MPENANVVEPQNAIDAFNCPHCRAYATQDWHFQVSSGITDASGKGNSMFPTAVIRALDISKCRRCEGLCVWVNSALVFPLVSNAPRAALDMPQEVAEVFKEARLVVNHSPRAAAALLRLCADKLCEHLGAEGKNLNEKIGDLVKKGLTSDIQKAFDSIRAYGNYALHPPGEILNKDNVSTASALFKLINLIVEKEITEKKMIDSIYLETPDGVRKSIDQRDGGESA